MRDGKFERLGGFEIYCEGELGGLLKRQIGRLGALEDAVDQLGNQVGRLRSIGSVRHQAASRTRKGCSYIAGMRRVAANSNTRLRFKLVSTSVTIMIPSGFSRVIEANAASKSSGSRTPSA